MRKTEPLVYLMLAVAGALWPLSYFIPFVAEHGFDLPLIVAELFANRISSFLAAELLVTAMVVLLFILWESRRLQMTRVWLYLLCLLTVGVSLALPLFLYGRYQAMRK